MRRTMIAGNWKMHLDRAGAVELAGGIAERAGSVGEVDLVVCPPSVYLAAVAEAAAGSPLAVGAQNMYHAPSGAFTGEISPAMVRDVGAKYVILGHSERRHVFGETDAEVNQKTLAAIEAGLCPIVCVGELLDEREAGRTSQVIEEQFRGSLADVPEAAIRSLVIAYEPVWAIGTGKVATPEQAEEVHADLRRLLTERYNAATGESVRILYGGSVKPDNASTLLSQPNVDGALVGGASLKVNDFLAIAGA